MSSGRHRRPSRMTSVLTAGGTVAGVIALSAAAPAVAHASVLPSYDPSPVRVADTLRAKIVTRPAEVTVKSGDSLSKIAGALCGNPRDWTGIFAANKDKISDPDLIYPGEKLVVSCKSAPLPAVVADTVTVRHKHYAAPVSSEVIGTSGMGGFQSCVIRAESGGRTQVMNSSGHYGLYQFSASTWAGHGGNPADFGHASAAEQTQVFWNTVHADGTSDWAPYDGC